MSSEPKEIYLGIMSGTSLDGIDVAACRFEDKTVDLLEFYSTEWPPDTRRAILNVATATTVPMDDLVRLHFELANEYALAVNAALEHSKISREEIRAIGLHGQTVRHLPYGRIPATMQLGSGPALAAIAGIDVVSDFRSADIALGGQGAPLVPMFDYRYLTSDSSDRLIVNIGGIANVTWLPQHAASDEVIAFDTGPGNMLMDAIAQKYFEMPFDRNGEIARSGTIDEPLLSELLSNDYFRLPPPKSTGRELFSDRFLAPLERKIASGAIDPRDALRTLAELSARTIASAFSWITRRAIDLEIIVSGGGANNDFLMECLRKNLPQARVASSDAYGIPSKAKEAIAFAFFAQAFIQNIPIHLPHTTGARSQIALGVWSKGKIF